MFLLFINDEDKWNNKPIRKINNQGNQQDYPVINGKTQKQPAWYATRKTQQ